MTNPNVRKALTLRLAGHPLRSIATELGVSPEMVRRYLKSAKASGFGLTVTIRAADGLEPQAAADALREYLDSIGLYRVNA